MGVIEAVEAIQWQPGVAAELHDGQRILRAAFNVTVPVIFDPGFQLVLHSPQAGSSTSNSRATMTLGWLPRGSYRMRVSLPAPLPAGSYDAQLEASHLRGMAENAAGKQRQACTVPAAAGGTDAFSWAVEAVAPTPALESLSWRKGHSDWFFRHFDHAATTVISYLLGDHPLLKGRILDVGCGDGITDLGIALRTGCQELIGVDPFRQFERLPGVIRDNHLPADTVPANLRFMAEDANYLPFPDDHFDVVISWGSIEHMAGGYLQALREVKRVLKHDGLFMVAPGLYYSNIGHHLDEFCKEPFFHLKMSRDEIRKMVLETPPRYIDRSGEFSSNEQFWQWFTELNPITVARLDQEMRALEFRPWRIALRTQDLVEYTPEIEHYPIQDLANIELYSSWINRKPPRPK